MSSDQETLFISPGDKIIKIDISEWERKPPSWSGPRRGVILSGYDIYNIHHKHPTGGPITLTPDEKYQSMRKTYRDKFGWLRDFTDQDKAEKISTFHGKLRLLGPDLTYYSLPVSTVARFRMVKNAPGRHTELEWYTLTRDPTYKCALNLNRRKHLAIMDNMRTLMSDEYSEENEPDS